MGYPRHLHRAHKHDMGPLGDLHLSEVDMEDLWGTPKYLIIKCLVLKELQIFKGCDLRR